MTVAVEPPVGSTTRSTALICGFRWVGLVEQAAEDRSTSELAIAVLDRDDVPTYDPSCCAVLALSPVRGRGNTPEASWVVDLEV